METTLSDSATGDAAEDVALRVRPKLPPPPANYVLIVSHNSTHLQRMMATNVYLLV